MHIKRVLLKVIVRNCSVKVKQTYSPFHIYFLLNYVTILSNLDARKFQTESNKLPKLNCLT